MLLFNIFNSNTDEAILPLVIFLIYGNSVRQQDKRIVIYGGDIGLPVHHDFGADTLPSIMGRTDIAVPEGPALLKRRL